jgi:hypothetical protein
MNRRSVRTVLLPLAFVPALALSCASAEEARPAGRSASVITAAELANMPDSDLLEVVERLRPRWLQPRGVTSLQISRATGQIVVYLDRTYLGGPDMLRQYRSGEVTQLRYLDAVTAAAELSGYDATRYVSGAIVIYTAAR